MILLYRLLGLGSVALAILGVALPLLPTVPFLLLAAFFFARSNPDWERRIIEHPRFGPPILAWRERGAIGPRGKGAAVIAFAVSAAMGLAFLAWPWSLLPSGVAVIGASWILTRPSR